MAIKEVEFEVAALRALNTERLELQRRANELKKQCDSLELSIIGTMQKLGLSTVQGGRLQVIEEPVATDWSAIHGYVLEHGALDLLQKRLTVSAVRLRWEDGVEIPGVDKYETTKLKLTE